MLPEPCPYSPEAVTRNENAAIAAIVELVPANAPEARFAADYVLCSEIARACLRDYRNGALHDKARAEAFKRADSMMRQARGHIASLLRLQGVRTRRDANPRTARTADHMQDHALHHLSIAFGRDIPAPAPPPLEPEVEPPQPERNEAPILTEGERYAAIYPKRARLIRENGGMPDLPFPHGFGPPPSSVIEELLTSQSPRILAVDTVE